MAHFFNIPFLKSKYLLSHNISKLMRESINSEINTKDIIETAYDIQAGSYIEMHVTNPQSNKEYFEEKALTILKFFPQATSLLDCGCGELTGTSLNYHKFLSSQINSFYSFDISWSRIYKGKKFFQEKTGTSPHCFIADMEHIPLPDNSIDLVTSSHALEPNHGSEEVLIKELLRVSRLGLALFEPSWELGDEEQKKRMDEHGYIRNLPYIIEKLGYRLIKNELLENQITQYNKTAMYIVKKNTNEATKASFVDPISKTPLVSTEENFLFSKTTGRVYPIIKNIPVLRKECSVLATHYE